MMKQLQRHAHGILQWLMIVAIVLGATILINLWLIVPLVGELIFQRYTVVTPPG